MSMISEQEAGLDEIVHVPVPRRYLPTVIRALADAMSPAVSNAAPAALGALVELRTGRRNMIDLIIKVAHELGADERPVSLAELHHAYMRAYPGIGKGSTRGAFDATINYHCINMRSRFPNVRDRHKPAYWLSRPVFKRVGYGQYELLSGEEITRFRRSVEEDNPLVYKDEYNIADLVPKEGDQTVTP